MFSKEILNKEIPVLKPDDSGLFALNLMNEWKLRHLPIVKDGHYCCLLSEKDVSEMNHPEEPVEGNCLYAPCANEDSFILDILQTMSKDCLTLLPVINGTGEYLGAITLPVLTERLNELCNAGTAGALIAIEADRHDFVLSKIIHLIETNNANVLNFFSYFIEETGRQILLFKIDLEDASPVLRSLERFNYTVRFYLQKQLLTDESRKKRLNELLYYLEM